MTRWLDLSYALTGGCVAHDYPADLYRALCSAAPWLDDEPLAGVHPIRGLTPCAGTLLIGGRTRLVLRVPDTRMAACESLSGSALALPEPLRVGTASARELLAHPVLHARLVVTGAEDDAAFAAEVGRAVDELELDCEIIVGRRGELRVGSRRWTGYSLMLHGLSETDSLNAQTRGIGLHRKFGCGLFVPHKSVAAVAL
jgi:CRISPR-associated protein Cas6